MDVHVRVRDLSVWYGAQRVLKNVSLDIPRHRITAIIGPSGCGKSTLLKSINRLLDITPGVRIQGSVVVDGVDVYHPSADVTDIRRKAGLLSQQPFPLPMSIFDNVAFAPRLHKRLRGSTLADLVEHYLRLAGLWDEVRDRLHEPASQLSVGQQQRLCLARGLAAEPEIILADEATSALDPISAQHIETCLVELKERYTVVVVTHILRQARRLADHVAFMYLGELVEAGPAEEVFHNPSHERTRQYLAGKF